MVLKQRYWYFLFILFLNSCALIQEYENIRPIEVDNTYSLLVYHEMDTTMTVDVLKENRSVFDIIEELDIDTIVIRGKERYIIENDLVMNQKHLLWYAMSLTEDANYEIQEVNRKRKSRRAFTTSPKLIGIKLNGVIVKLDDYTNIRYSIVRNSFTNEEYKLICNLMDKATQDWENSCGVRFKHIEQNDQVLDRDNVLGDLSFIVQKESMSKSTATAFFPFDDKSEHIIKIDDSFFSSNYSKEGILRHELGHTLGFLHEHIHNDAPSPCKKSYAEKPRGAQPYVPGRYDPSSVMIVYCRKLPTGAMNRSITETDKKLAQEHYPNL